MELFEDIWQIISTAEHRNYLLEGFLNTLIITIIAAAIGLVLGIIIAIIKVFAQDNKYFKSATVIYSGIILSTKKRKSNL